MSKATINPKNDNKKCFKYAIAAALNYEETPDLPERNTTLML